MWKIRSKQFQINFEKYMADLISVPAKEFHRMVKALEKVEAILSTQQEPWVNTEKAMELLGCGRTHLWRLQNRGAITAKKVGKELRFSRKSIDRCNAENTNK
jgi:hypothetical protein